MSPIVGWIQANRANNDRPAGSSPPMEVECGDEDSLGDEQKLDNGTVQMPGSQKLRPYSPYKHRLDNSDTMTILVAVGRSNYLALSLTSDIWGRDQCCAGIGSWLLGLKS